MKYALLACIILFSLPACKPVKSQNTKSEVQFSIVNCDSECIVLGELSRNYLKKDSLYNKWYNKNYDNYRLDTKTIAKLNEVPQEDYTVKIFLGSWCGDSKREVPRFYRILDAIDFNDKHVSLYGLDKKKKSPQQFEKNLNIIKVPTVIIYKNGKELNRIVEIPVESLEKDLLNIITVNTYKNTYSE